jgi:hypothetical protein
VDSHEIKIANKRGLLNCRLLSMLGVRRFICILSRTKMGKLRNRGSGGITVLTPEFTKYSERFAKK